MGYQELTPYLINLRNEAPSSIAAIAGDIGGNIQINAAAAAGNFAKPQCPSDEPPEDPIRTDAAKRRF
jgi:hypothetical protein